MKTQRAPEMASLTCSDLLTAYRLSQSLNRNRQRPYKYDPAETMDLHRYPQEYDTMQREKKCPI